MIDFVIRAGKEHMQVAVVGELLRATYWANGRSDAIVEKSMQKSDCYGAFLAENRQQIGFARVVTDDATFLWVCDVVVDPRYRGHGIGKRLLETIQSQPKYRPMLGLLATSDAHGLYEQYGFVRSGDERFMQKPKGV